jgi:hypothetical protein
MLHPREDYQRIQDPAGLIPKDEPVFILRAQDKAAAQTVRYWADRHIELGGDPVLASMARSHARTMDLWPVKKLADLPERSTAEPPAEPAAESEKDTVDLPAEPSAEEITEPAKPPEQPAQMESKPGAGVVSPPAEPAKKDTGVNEGAGKVSEPDTSQTKDGSGLV